MEATARLTPAWRNVAVVVAVLAGSNVMTNRVLPSPLYVPWSLAMVGLLLWHAVEVDGRRLVELGFDPRNARRGLAWGAVAFGAIAAVYLVAVAVPLTRDLFRDDRVGDVPALGLAYQALVRIPLGTVVLEETAFRGVLLGMLMVRTTVWRGVFWSSFVFGLWHVLPAVGIERTNPLLERLLGEGTGRVVAVLGAVVGTAAAGYVFCFLRLRSDSIVAPMLLHVATNSLGFVVSWFVIRWS